MKILFHLDHHSNSIQNIFSFLGVFKGTSRFKMKASNCLAKEKKGGKGGAGGRGEKAIGRIVKAQLCPFSKL